MKGWFQLVREYRPEPGVQCLACRSRLIHPARGRRRRYCAETCRHRRYRAKLRAPRPTHCAACPRELPVSRFGRPRTYCTRRCRERAAA